MTRRAYRVLHAPTSVGGHPQGLSHALRTLGIDSESWIHQQNQFGYAADRVLWTGGEGLIRREWIRLVAIFRAAFTFDVIHYNFGTTLATPFPPPFAAPVGRMRRIVQWLHRHYLWRLFLFELLLLRLLGRPVFVHYQGDDARQGDRLAQLYAVSVATQVPEGFYRPASDDFKRRMIERLGRACERVYVLNPDLMHLMPPGARFQPYGHVFPSDWTPVYNQGDAARPLRIVHAPTNRAAKGTDLVLEAVDRLRAQGFGMELVLVENMPRDEARLVYARADVVVDQLFYGWYGGLAVEAMALGKPVVVYLREEDLRFVPPQMQEEMPFIRVTPATIEAGLRGLLEMPRPDLLALARRSRSFVERWHDPSSIAAELRSDYEDALRRHGKHPTCAASQRP